MSLVQRLQILITADGKAAAAEFRKIGKTAADESAKASTGLRKVSDGIKTSSMVAVAGVGSAVIAFGAGMAKSYESAAKETMKLQRLTGATAEDASRLRVVAQQTGMDVDKLGTAFVRLSKTAQTSGGKSALQDLGVSLTDASGKTLPLKQQLMNLSDGFARSGDAALKNKAALALFGKSGADLLPLLNRGSKGIDELMKKSDKLGLTLGQKDLDKVKDYIKAQRDLGLSFQSLKEQIGKEVFPAFAAGMRLSADAATTLVGVFAKLPAPLKETTVAVGGLAASAAVVFGTGGLLLKGAFAAYDSYGRFASRIADTSAFQKLSGAVRDSEGNLTRLGGIMKGFGAVAIGAAAVGAVIEIGNAFNKASQDAETFDRSLRVLGGGQSGNKTLAFTQMVNALTGTLDDLSVALDASKPKQFGVLTINPLVVALNSLFGNDSDLISKIKVGSKSMSIDLNQLGEAVDKLKDSGDIVAMSAALNAIGNVMPTNAAQIREVSKQAVALEEARDNAVQMAAAERSAAVETQNMTAAARSAGIAAGTYAATSADLGDKIAQLDGKIRDLSSGYNIAQAAAKGWASGVAQTSGLVNEQVDAAQAIAAAQKGMGESIANLPRTFDLNAVAAGKYTDEQNKAIDAVQGFGAAVQKSLQNQLALGGSYDQVAGSARTYEAALRSQLAQIGVNDQATQDYYVSLAGLDGKTILTSIALSDAEQAKQQLQILQGDFDSLPEEKRSQIYAAISRNDWVAAKQLYDSFKDKRVNIDATVNTNMTGWLPAGALNTLLGRASGGVVPGGSHEVRVPGFGSDTVPAMLTPGEFVIRRDAVKRLGVDRLSALNAGKVPRFASGGVVMPSLAPQRSVPPSTAPSAGFGPGPQPLIGTLIQNVIDRESAPREIARAAMRAKALTGR